MTRIKIKNISEVPKYSADYILKSRKVLRGEEIARVLKIDPSRKDGIRILKLERPLLCPKCLTEGKVVNYKGKEGNFRCMVCQHKWR